MTDYDLVVIGGGSAGLVVAIGGAGLGAKVALVEKTKIGGDCTHYGCVPSKTLLHSAKVAWQARQGKHVGVDATVKVDFKKVIAHVQEVIAGIYAEETPEKVTEKGVEVVIGDARFLDKHTLAIGDRQLTAKKFAICTGSRAFVPPIQGLQAAGYLTNHEIFSLKKQPKSLLIIGGGPIGAEMGQAFSRLGSKVTIVEKGDHILSREDADVALELQDVLVREGVAIVTKSSVVSVQQTKKGKEVTIDNDGVKKTILADEILVSTGRVPNIEGLGLDEIGVKYNNRGLLVNDRLQTTVKNIYAAGDVTGRFLFTHVAAYEAGIVLRNALFKMRARVDYSLVPWTTFTEPELAHVGASTENSREFPFSRVDRAKAEDAVAGKVKVAVDKKGVITGVTILSANAGELIHEWIVAMQNKMTLTSLNDMIHVYPTLSLANKGVSADAVKAGFTPGKKKLLKFLFRLRG